MDVLILGGTRFLGIHITDALRARGHRVTHFTRTSVGDRRTDLHRAGDGPWDAVVDTCGYASVDVEISARYFARRAARYAFISTVSVYDPACAAPDEDAPVTRAEPYGAGKAACERVVAGTFRHRALILRPSLIVGPHDPTDRFTYWPLRFARGGTVLAPESPAYATQFVDARDVADFLATCLERGTGGTYNVASPPGVLRLGPLFDLCREAARVPSEVRWVSASFLAAHDVAPWTGLPLWIPAAEGMPGFFRTDVRRALGAGLRFRATAQTVRDTLAWAEKETPSRALRAGLSADRERELLLAWDASD